MSREMKHTCDGCKNAIQPGQTFLTFQIDKREETATKRAFPKSGEKVVNTFANLDLCESCASQPLDLKKLVEWETDEYTVE